MKLASILLILLWSAVAVTCMSSCSTVKRVATPENIWRAFDIYEAGEGIYRDVIITPEK